MKIRTLITATTAAVLALSTVAPLAASAQSMPTQQQAQFRPVFQQRQTGTTSPLAREAMLRQRAASTTSPLEREALLHQRMTASGTPERGVLRGNASGTPMFGGRDQMIARAQERATQEIDRRISALQAFETRIGNVHTSSSTAAALQATMQEQISNLSALKDQISSDTSTTTMKDALQSIAQSYRIFALVMPQSAILAAADRVHKIVSQMQELTGKLTDRLSSSSSTPATAALTDLKAKIADATSQAQAAVDEVNGLSANSSDPAQFSADKSALQDAHKKLQAAQQDLVDARKDAGTIVQALRGAARTNTATTTATSTAQ